MSVRGDIIDAAELAMKNVPDTDMEFREYATAATDAVLATIKASVPELVWDERNHAGYYRTQSTHGQDKHPYILMCGVNPVWGYDSVEDAKAAAQAHHVAQKTDWMDE